MKIKTRFFKHVSIIALAALAIQTSTPKKSQALGGFIAAGIPMAVSVLGVVSGGALIFGGGAVLDGDTNVGLGLDLILLGVIFLDGGNSNFELSPLSEQAGEKIGINTAERAAYNSELEEVRAIHQSITAGSISDGKLDLKKAEKLWDTYRNQVSPEAFSALTKVSQFTVKSMKQH